MGNCLTFSTQHHLQKLAEIVETGKKYAWKYFRSKMNEIIFQATKSYVGKEIIYKSNTK
jgi:hypothetical protein